MNTAVIEKSFREKVCAKIRIVLEGDERFRVFTPFLFEDGDHLAIVLKKQENTWVLSDEGHTYMHLTYDLDEKDFQKGTRQKIISSALSAFRVEDRDGVGVPGGPTIWVGICDTELCTAPQPGQ